MLVRVALANKMARIVWALLAKGGVYWAPVAAVAWHTGQSARHAPQSPNEPDPNKVQLPNSREQPCENCFQVKRNRRDMRVRIFDPLRTKGGSAAHSDSPSDCHGATISTRVFKR
jgi:hypothetical protein